MWVVDFLVNLGGFSLTGMTDYMFQSNHSLSLRLLSLFHGWMPFLLLYLVWKIGYDRRALWPWTGLFWAVMLVCFFFMPPPTPDPGLTPVNINYVWGMRDTEAQTMLPAWLWLVSLMIGVPLFVFMPTHFIFSMHHAGAALMLARSPKPGRLAALWVALRFAWRELRGGLRGFGVFIACIALGVMAIAGVGSVAASLNDGIASAGRVILGGDVAFSLIQRQASDAERAFLDAHGTSFGRRHACARWRAPATAARRWSRSRRSTAIIRCSARSRPIRRCRLPRCSRKTAAPSARRSIRRC